jgi:hypothetical protein
MRYFQVFETIANERWKFDIRSIHGFIHTSRVNHTACVDNSFLETESQIPSKVLCKHTDVPLVSVNYSSGYEWWFIRKIECLILTVLNRYDSLISRVTNSYKKTIFRSIVRRINESLIYLLYWLSTQRHRWCATQQINILIRQTDLFSHWNGTLVLIENAQNQCNSISNTIIPTIIHHFLKFSNFAFIVSIYPTFLTALFLFLNLEMSSRENYVKDKVLQSSIDK